MAGDYQQVPPSPVAATTAVGAVDDAAAQTVAADKSAISYLKGILDVLLGTTGAATFPAAAAPANAVSALEVLRYVVEKQLGRWVLKNTGDMSSGYGTGDSPVTLFTVTGEVEILAVVGFVKTPLTSTSSTGTVSVGTANSVAFLLPTTTADGTEFAAAGDVWVDATPRDDVDVLARSNSIVIGGGSDIILTIATNDITAGDLDIYVLYRPISSDGAVVAA